MPVIGCHAGIEGAVPAPGLLEEQIQTVLLENVERVRSAHHAELFEARARRRNAVDPRVVEHPELILGEAIEILPAEPGAVQVHFVEHVEVEIA